MKSLVEKDVLRLKGSDADSLLTTSSPVGTEDTRVRGVLANVELFEWIGIAASVAAAGSFLLMEGGWTNWLASPITTGKWFG